MRYRYYASQAVRRKRSPGPIGRVPASELEAMVVETIRRHLQGNDAESKPIPETDRELIERHLLRVTLSANEVIIHLRQDGAGSGPKRADTTSAAIAIPWTAPAPSPAKGIVYAPAHNTPMKPGSREVLLVAIAKARRWIKEVERGHSFADIARREGKAERYVRQLAPLAFVSPRVIIAILDGTAPAALTMTTLAAGLPYSWAEQEQRTGTTQ